MNKTVEELQVLILEWAKEKGIDNPARQYLKTLEEIGETAKAILMNDRDEILDGIGDIGVTLIILYDLQRTYIATDETRPFCEGLDLVVDSLSHMSPWILRDLNDVAYTHDTTLQECLNIAWEVISKRTGKTVNGTFIKDNKNG